MNISPDPQPHPQGAPQGLSDIQNDVAVKRKHEKKYCRKSWSILAREKIWKQPYLIL